MLIKTYCYSYIYNDIVNINKLKIVIHKLKDHFLTQANEPEILYIRFA